MVRPELTSFFRQAKALGFPERYLCIAIDAIDQRKASVPRTRIKSKLGDGLPGIPFPVMAARVCCPSILKFASKSHFIYLFITFLFQVAGGVSRSMTRKGTTILEKAISILSTLPGHSVAPPSTVAGGSAAVSEAPSVPVAVEPRAHHASLRGKDAKRMRKCDDHLM